MPLPELQLRECLGSAGAFLQERRPPPEIREKVDLRTNIKGQEFVLLEVRPAYDDETLTIEHPIVRARWVGTEKVWRVYWMRADLKWHRYDPLPETQTIAEVLAEVKRDPYGCFFG